MFERLTAPAVAIGQLGTLRIERNSVRECHAGFWLVTQDASHVLTFLDRLVNQAGDAYRDLVNAHLTALAEPLLFHTTVLARTLPAEVAEDSDADWSRAALELPSEATSGRPASCSISFPHRTPRRSLRRDRRSERDWRRRFVETFGRVRGTRRRPEP